MEKIKETIIAKAKSALSWPVKAAVCSINPGPMDEVAIKKAAPNKTDKDALLFIIGFIRLSPIYKQSIDLADRLTLYHWL